MTNGHVRPSEGGEPDGTNPVSRQWRRFRRWTSAQGLAALERRSIVCPCHDATLADVRSSWSAGYQHPETLKRATAVFMGSCQGKMCAPTVKHLLTELQGDAGTEPRRPSVRPPLYPVRLGQLAGDLEDPDGTNDTNGTNETDKPVAAP